MVLTQLMRRFTVRARMLGTVAIVTIALLAVGGVGLAAQFYARSVNASFIAKDFAAMTQIAQLRTAMSTASTGRPTANKLPASSHPRFGARTKSARSFCL